jgi:AraC family carnitine catabolism transcriptional activator
MVLNNHNAEVFRPVTVAIVLAQRFPLLSLAACSESLRVANRECGGLAFNRLLLTTEDEPVFSSSGISVVPDVKLAEAPFADVVLVLSSYQPDEACHPPFLVWLRKQHRLGAVIGCVDTGSYILAKAGILGTHKVAVHRETLSAYRELLGNATLLDRFFETDGPIVSSAGGIATLDMMLGLIARFQNRSLADRIAFVLNYPPLKAAPISDEAAGGGMIARVDRRLARMIEIMQTNIENPVQVAAICKKAKVPSATANRLFLRHFRASPSRYYMTMRLERALHLLGNSPLPIRDIAAKVGFADASAFTRAYRLHFGKLPSSSRRQEPGLVTSSQRFAGAT